MIQDSDESETGKCECLSSYRWELLNWSKKILLKEIIKNNFHSRQKADRTCEEDVPLSQPRVASSTEAGTGAGAVIAAVLCILALIVISILGVTFVRYLHIP